MNGASFPVCQRRFISRSCCLSVADFVGSDASGDDRVETLGDGLADATGRPGNDCGFASQIEKAHLS